MDPANSQIFPTSPRKRGKKRFFVRSEWKECKPQMNLFFFSSFNFLRGFLCLGGRKKITWACFTARGCVSCWVTWRAGHRRGDTRGSRRSWAGGCADGEGGVRGSPAPRCLQLFIPVPTGTSCLSLWPLPRCTLGISQQATSLVITGKPEPLLPEPLILLGPSQIQSSRE